MIKSHLTVTLRQDQDSLTEIIDLKECVLMVYHVVYDGNCNLCVNLVKLLEQLDQGQQFQYTPMQDQAMLAEFGITPQDCELGMLLINAEAPEQRWQGSTAAEEIGRRLPAGELFVEAYRALPGIKWAGDRFYEQIRDNRYRIFGKRSAVYDSLYPSCADQQCGGQPSSNG